MSELKAIEKTKDEIINDLKNRVMTLHFDNKYRKNSVLYEDVTYQEYADAIIHLFKLAATDCGGAYYASQVLLSLYNGNEFHVDLARVACNLDSHYLNSVMVAIKGRGQLMTEPHNVIEDGSKHFGELWRQCESLHVRERYQSYYEGR
ncbi:MULTISPECIES: hypothetical protein [unclassified Methylophaga]|jgi:hypothetical protein|uniref:DUF7673 family protein n=1 Tax=unclassified Methylophaga TaxID=2629249 RepID=UPI000C944DB4|nr:MULTISPECIES: hypothetical protein [unclassified Methylophaga]MAK67533.1 hypothetical protein [Methylophaga sp.]MAY18766.1 hypothetical protein [Methylophaga sp.]HAO25743.1 hypothetical protein [Methylophaga sp.]HCD04443.1 hypothetical protein [Methylophaga sp.]|tara:strand:+ start:42366 stop:42809 length:444 start_codon:yes stop_codon:yes gene_type:complete